MSEACTLQRQDVTGHGNTLFLQLLMHVTFQPSVKCEIVSLKQLLLLCFAKAGNAAVTLGLLSLALRQNSSRVAARTLNAEG